MSSIQPRNYTDGKIDKLEPKTASVLELVTAYLSGAVKLEVETGISAAGTTQGAATGLTKTVNVIDSITAASAEAVRLPACAAGLVVWVINIDSADPLKIFPASGDSIMIGATDAVDTDLNAGIGRLYIGTDDSIWGRAN